MNNVLYSTEDLAKMFSVGQTTIKRWADEGKLKCVKTPGGHRKFTAAIVHQFIEQYNYEVVSPILPFARTSETIAADSVMVVGETPPQTCFFNAIRGKSEPIEQALSSLAVQGKSLSAIFDSLLLPLLRFIQEKHLNNLITPIEFQISKNTLLNALIHFADRIPKTGEKNLELYCLSAQEGMNEVELKAVELLLDNMGITVYNLGTVLSKYSASEIVNYCKPEDVFVVMSSNQFSKEALDQFHSLTEGVKSYGGNVHVFNLFDVQETLGSDGELNQWYSFHEIAEQFSTHKAVHDSDSVIVEIKPASEHQ